MQEMFECPKIAFNLQQECFKINKTAETVASRENAAKITGRSKSKQVQASLFACLPARLGCNVYILLE